MKVTVYFPRDSRNPRKGVKVEEVEVPSITIRECIKGSEGNRSRFVDCIADYIIEELAIRYCRAVIGEVREECVTNYVYNQGEAIRGNVEAAVKSMLLQVAEILKRCGRNRACIMAGLYGESA